MKSLKQLVTRQDIANAVTTLGTVGTNKKWTVQQISLFNHTATPRPINIYMALSGSAGSTNQIKSASGKSVPPYTLELINISEALSAGGGISADDNGAGGNVVNIGIFGIEEDI